MKNKILSLLLVSAMAVTMLAGCGDSNQDTPASEDAAQEEETTDTPEEDADDTADSGNEITLKTVSMFGGTDLNQEAYKAINEQFQIDNENIKIEDNSATADQDWKAMISADFSVGNEPDVIQFFTDATAESVLATDKFVSIEEIRAEYPDYAGDIKDMALAAVANPDGVQRAVPTTGYWEGLFCNKALFEQYGAELPTDWESLLKAIETFKANDITPISVSLNNVPHYWVEYLMLYTAGPEEFVEIPETAPESWAKGLDAFKTLRDLGAFPVDTDTIDDAFAGNMFKEGKSAMHLEGSWFAGDKDPETTVVIAFPGVPEQKAEPSTIISGLSSGFYITKKAWDDPEKRDAAVKFVMAHTSKEGIKKYWEATGKIQVTAAEIDAPTDLTPFAKSALDYVNSATSTVLPTDSRIGADPYTVIISNISKISVGEVTSKEVIDEALQSYAEIKEAAE